MLEGICSECRFWEVRPGVTRGDGAKIGKCKRRAPRLVISPDGRQHAGFPHMVENDG